MPKITKFSTGKGSGEVYVNPHHVVSFSSIGGRQGTTLQLSTGPTSTQDVDELPFEVFTRLDAALSD